MGKAAFLQAIASGEYLPLRLATTDSSIRYKLYHLTAAVPSDALSTLRYYGDTYYKYYKREGERLPAINYTDVNGKLYNEAALSGKILVLKCWFVHCAACVKEMPRLNRLQKEFGNRDDILFLSVAFDTREKLKAFLEKTAFNYAVIPVPESYIEDTLQVHVYPTHFIVNKKGIITKVADNADDLEDALHSQLAKKEL
jgi:peroxiredoxin